MEPPRFTATGDRVWTWSGRRAASCYAPDIQFTTKSKWYSLGRWSVTAVSKLALPIPLVVYISRQGPAYGYWRNAPIGSDYFGYCDAPALMPILIGDATRAAIDAHDTRSTDGSRNPVELHIKDAQLETTTKTDATVLDDVIAIHRALTEDHADLLDEWKRAADQLNGILSTTWPPQITVPRAFGPTTIALRWPPSSHSTATASIELTVDARHSKLWSIEREQTRTPNARMLAERPYLVLGDVPLALDQLARVIARADILSITVRRYAIVRIARYTPEPEILDDVLSLLALICGDASSPYR